MTLEQLFALGATSCAGAIDLKNQHIGTLLASGEVLLTPDGEEIVAAATTEPAPAEAPKAPAKKVAAKKVAKPAVDDEPDLGSLLLGDDE